MNVRPSALILKNGSFLTLKYRYSGQEVFALPGGNPDPGESLTDALSREFHEELGVKLNIGPMLFCGEVIWKEVGRETLHMVFTAEILEGEPVLNPAETKALEVVWLPVNEACERILYPNVGKEIKLFEADSSTKPHLGVLSQPYLP